LLVVKSQGARKEGNGLALRRAAIGPFERADSSKAHSSALREGFLRKPRGQSVAPQEGPKIRRAGFSLFAFHF
jgi:hypothetical protein